MRVLITRPAEEAMRTAQALVARGHEPLVAPMVDVRYFDGPELFLENVQTILVTSGNGVRALARRTGRRDIAVFAVGTRTAERARAEGFVHVLDAAGDASALIALVRNSFRPDQGPLLHVSGSNASKTLQRELTLSGYKVDSRELYDMLELPLLPDNVVDAMRTRSLDAVLLFSPRSAHAFADRALKSKLEDACRNLVACCISNATGDALAGLAFREIRIALRPDQTSVLDLLDAATSSE